MIEQRKRLNLIRSQTPVLPSRPDVIPVVAVQRGMSQELRDRLFTVRRHLTDQGIAEASRLQVYEVTSLAACCQQTAATDCAYRSAIRGRRVRSHEQWART
jgi:hypothetical protein